MDIIKSYRRNIIENKNTIFISTLVACIIRVLVFNLYPRPDLVENTGGYLWSTDLDEYFLKNDILSFFLSTLFSLGIALYISILNAKYKLIRNQTYLAYAFAVVLFSIYPIFIYMGSQYISLLLLLLSFDILMGAYLETRASFKVSTMGFILGLSSMFSLYSLIYIPIYLIGFKLMRYLNLRNILAYIFGITSTYWIAFFILLWLDRSGEFWEPFKLLYPILDKGFITDLNFIKTFFLITGFSSLVLLSINYQLFSFQDKIQVRTNLYFVLTICFFSFITYAITVYDHTLNLFVFTSSISILLAHFFTLTSQKWIVYFFYSATSILVIYSTYLLIDLISK